MTAVEQWWTTPQHNLKNYNRNRETHVRAWRPGDGIHCSMANNQKVTACGVPVAVIKDINRRTDYRGTPETKVMTKNACLRHLAARFTGANPSLEEPGDERAALEELAAKHWDEFQQIVDARKQALRDARLSALPEELRASVAGFLEQEDGQS